MPQTYEQKIQEQIDQYRDVDDMQKLPSAHTFWTSNFVAPRMREVFGTIDVTEFYVDAFISSGGAPPCYLSIGCGDGEVEIPIARALARRGVGQFRFVCVDLSDVLLARFRAAIPSDLAEHFELLQGDLNTLQLAIQFDAVMANHSLHHMLDLEAIFAVVHANLSDAGVFVTSDVIGRNGHMRWPETRLLVDLVWPLLTRRQRYNVPLRRLESRFLDHDCSTVGFEGIRSQDILPLLLQQGFQPWKFLGFGGAIDVFVDRCFGYHFDLADEDDAFLLHRIGALNDLLLDAGLIKPTMMFAYFSKSARVPTFCRERTASRSVRDTTGDPAWLAAALSDLAASPCNEEFVFRARAAVAHEDDTLRAALLEAQAQAGAARRDLEQQRQRMQALTQSTSWQLTAPLRFVARQARRAIAR